MHEGKMLLVRHAHIAGYVALPGGHVEQGESPEECIIRELQEELGVTPIIGRLLYVNTFVDRGEKQCFEFFFEITNGEAYLDAHNLERSHAHEIAEIVWVSKDDTVRMMPKTLDTDFREGNVLKDGVRFIKD
jgi:ADP-ribose pyrophosphatase YjhB (NUDIX family)